MRESEVLRIRKNHFLAPVGIEHDLGLFELGRVVLEPAHLEWLRRHEPVPARLVAGLDSIDRERNDLWFLGLRPESCDNGMQRPHPSKRARLLRLLAPAHRLRPGECLHHFRHDLGEHVNRRPALLLDHCHVKVAPLVGHDFSVTDRLEAGRAQKPLDGALRRADARAFPLLL